jgi:fatty acid desaturase
MEIQHFFYILSFYFIFSIIHSGFALSLSADDKDKGVITFFSVTQLALAVFCGIVVIWSFLPANIINKVPFLGFLQVYC